LALVFGQYALAPGFGYDEFAASESEDSGMLHHPAAIRPAHGGDRPEVRSQIEVNAHALHSS
jgi:hypothetical protein